MNAPFQGSGNRFKLVIFPVPVVGQTSSQSITRWAFEGEELKGSKRVAINMERRILKGKLDNKYRTAILYDTHNDKEVAKWVNGVREF